MHDLRDDGRDCRVQVTRRGLIGVAGLVAVGAVGAGLMSGLKPSDSISDRVFLPGHSGGEWEPSIDEDTVQRFVTTANYVPESSSDKFVAVPQRVSDAVGGGHLDETSRFLRVSWTLADASEVPDKTVSLDEFLHDENLWMNAMIYNMSSMVRLYDAGGDRACAYIGCPLDVELGDGLFARDNDFAEMLDGCRVDYETKVAYVPMEYLDDGDVRLQILAFIEPETMERPSSRIHVHVESEDENLVPPVEDGYVDETIWTDMVRIPVTDADHAANLADMDVYVYGNGQSLPFSSYLYGLDVEDGSVVLRVVPHSLVSVEVAVKQRGADPLGAVTAAILPIEAHAHKSKGDASVIANRLYPWGYIQDNSWFAVGRRFNYWTKAADFFLETDKKMAKYLFGDVNGQNDAGNPTGYLKPLSKACWVVTAIEGVNYETATDAELLDVGCQYHRWGKWLGEVSDDFDWDTLSYSDFADAPDLGAGKRVYSHFFTLPGDKVARGHSFTSSDSTFPAALKDPTYWETIKSGYSTNSQQSNRANDCVLGAGACAVVNDATPASMDGSYEGGKGLARIIAIDRNADEPYVIFAFATPPFGTTDPIPGTDGHPQACQVVIAFALRTTAYLQIEKKLDPASLAGTNGYNLQATFSISDADGNLIMENVKTNASTGLSEVIELWAGTFKITETQPPAHCEISGSNPVSVTLTGAHTKKAPFVHTRKDKVMPTPFRVRKVSKVDIDPTFMSENNITLAGAVYRITRVSTGEYWEDTTDASGYTPIRKLYAGDYTIQEIKAPANFIRDDTVYDFTLSSQSDTYVHTVANMPRGDMKLQKQTS